MIWGGTKQIKTKPTLISNTAYKDRDTVIYRNVIDSQNNYSGWKGIQVSSTTLWASSQPKVFKVFKILV